MADESRRTVTTADLERCAWQQVIADAAEKHCFHYSEGVCVSCGNLVAFRLKNTNGRQRLSIECASLQVVGHHYLRSCPLMSRTVSALLVHRATMQDMLTIRIDTTLKQKAEKKAAEQDQTISQVVRRALRDYVSARHSHAGYKPATNANRKQA
jgi:hypothetical protein